MLDALREFGLYGIPWWLWSAPAAVGGVGIFLAVSRFLSWRTAMSTTLAFVAMAAIGLASARGRQAGWKDRIKKENRDADRLIKRANDARARARKRHPDRLYDDDGFKRG